MSKTEEAAKLFNSGFNCSQSVLAVFSEELGLDRDTALKLTSGFGSGMNRGEICGTVSGAVMALGLKFGHCKSDDRETRRNMRNTAKEFTRRFEAKNGCLICRDLLQNAIASEQEDAETGGRKCTKFVMDSVEILEEMLHP